MSQSKYRGDPQWLVSLVNRDGSSCWYCGVQLAMSKDMIFNPRSKAFFSPDGMETPTRDHQNPRSRGGSNRNHNLVLACQTCNLAKRAMTVAEYRTKLEHELNKRVVFAGEVTA